MAAGIRTRDGGHECRLLLSNIAHVIWRLPVADTAEAPNWYLKQSPVACNQKVVSFLVELNCIIRCACLLRSDDSLEAHFRVLMHAIHACCWTVSQPR